MKNIVLGVDPVDDKVNVRWVTIRYERVRFIGIKTGTLEQLSDIDFDHYITLIPTSMVDLKVLERRQNYNPTLLNDFMITYVLGQYT